MCQNVAKYASNMCQNMWLKIPLRPARLNFRHIEAGNGLQSPAFFLTAPSSPQFFS